LKVPLNPKRKFLRLKPIYKLKVGERNMVDCPKCAKKNDDDSVFCTHCGSSLKPDVASTIEQQAVKFAQNIEQMGKNLGESMTHAAQRVQKDSQDMGKRVEHRVDHASKTVENWYDHTFGVLGPLLSSFLFLIILRLAVEVVRISGKDLPEMDAITSVILLYLLPLFCIILLSNYTTYFAKKSYKFRIFSPLFHSIAFVLILWTVAQILSALQSRLQIADLGEAAKTIESILPTVFIFVLLLGYVVLAMNIPREYEKKP
jgi:hypothetical protein